MTEEKIKEALVSQTGISEEAVRIPRKRRLFAEISAEMFEKVFLSAKNTLGFSHLLSITGFDEGDNLGFMYHLARDNGIVLNLKISVPKHDSVIPSVTRHFPGAEIYERELVDLFGARVQGLPEGGRYPLAEEWPAGEYPLRKDWKASGKGGE